MKRYDVVLGRSGGRPHARCDETPEGAYVRHYVAQRLIDAKQAEIDALKQQNAELVAALQAMVGEYGEFYGDTPEVAAQSQSPLIKSALAAIAKARGEQHV